MGAVVLGALVFGDVAIDNTVCSSKLFEGIQGAVSRLLSPEAIGASSKEACEVRIGYARWCCAPVNDGRVIDLFSERGRAARLIPAIYRQRWKGYNIVKQT